jgi:hypothetical protein
MAHIYVLPDGRRAFTMKEARKLLGLSATAFKSLVRKGTVVKEISNSGQTQMLQGYGKDN